MPTPRKSTAAFWIIVAVVLLPVVYVASFGPACWAVERGWLPIWPAAIVYRPLVRAWPKNKTSGWLFTYAHAFTPRRGCGALWNTAGSD